MPQIIGFFIGVFLLVYVVAGIVWAAQWVWASWVWFYQVFLMPLFVYFLPSLLLIVMSIGIIVGSWVAIQNYFSALNTQMQPEDNLGYLIKHLFLGFTAITLVVIYLLFFYYVEPIVVHSAWNYMQAIESYYAQIQYPSFVIHFPFWEKL